MTADDARKLLIKDALKSLFAVMRGNEAAETRQDDARGRFREALHRLHDDLDFAAGEIEAVFAEPKL